MEEGAAKVVEWVVHEAVVLVMLVVVGWMPEVAEDAVAVVAAARATVEVEMVVESKVGMVALMAGREEAGQRSYAIMREVTRVDPTLQQVPVHVCR